MRDLIIFGAGGFGREIALLVRQINMASPAWNILGFCDDNLQMGSTVDGLEILGGLSEINKRDMPTAVVLAVADPGVRRMIRNKIENTGISFPAIIHPSVLTGDIERNHIGEGCILAAGNILTTNIRINSFVIVNLACTIGHDVTIGTFSSIMPGCSLSGFITIESQVVIGTGSRILPGITVGERSRVGAGAVVTRNVERGTTVVGIPATDVKGK